MNTSIKKLDDGRQTESMTSLFLSQSYQDAWDDYARSLKKEGFARWDYIVLTASNEEQAEGFHAQIALRQKEKLLPSQTRFLILPDPDGKRVGSGGATLNVLRAIAEAEGTGDFTGKKILVIHSGGDSKRVPQYSAMGKLFSPVPHELPDGRTSTLFDEFMAEMSGVAGRIREGMVLLSGDVLLLFNSLQIDFPEEVQQQFPSRKMSKSVKTTESSSWEKTEMWRNSFINRLPKASVPREQSTTGLRRYRHRNGDLQP